MSTRFFDHMTESPARVTESIPRVTLEQILDLTRFLKPSDRALLQSIYQSGVSASAMARAMGGNSRTVRRRVLNLVRRMSGPTFRFVVRHRMAWSPRRRAIAEAVVLRGETYRAAARHLNTSLHYVRREVDCILALSEANSPHDQQREYGSGTPTGFSNRFS